MIEVYSHNYLKNLLKKNSLIWPHNLTLSRLVSRSLRRRDKSIFEVTISQDEEYWPGVLIPLCLKSCGVVLLVTQTQKRRLLQIEIPRLNDVGLTLPVWEGFEPPTDGKLWVLDHANWTKAFFANHLHSKQLIFPEAELMSSRLREAMTIQISSSHWDCIGRVFPSVATRLVSFHEKLSRRLFSEVIRSDAVVRIDERDTCELIDLLRDLDHPPEPWASFVDAVTNGWASWAQLDQNLLDWTWYLQPLEPLQILHTLFLENPFILLSSSIQNQFESIKTIVNVNIKIGGPIHQEPIKLFAPFRQPLPNAECFAEHLLDQSRRLIVGRQGITVIILDDDQLLKRLTSELAAEFGRRVIFKSTAPEVNGIVCCSSSWWVESQDKLPDPEQLIIALLPISSLESPLTAARVEAFKKEGLDWFRGLLLPELLSLLPKLVLPIRKNNGRIAILDGRLRSRSWGKKILETLEPWTPLDRLLPD